MLSAFCHLHVHSAFSFLDSSASVQDLVRRAAEMGQPMLALTDANSITGVPSFVKACAKANIKPIGGCTVSIDGSELVLLADGPTGWSSLCQILTAAGLRDVKRKGLAVTWDDLETWKEGIVCLSGSFQRGRLAALVRARRYKQAAAYARRCRAVFGGSNYFIEVTRTLAEGEHGVSCRLLQLAEHIAASVVAANPVHHATKVGLAAYEVLCRVRLGLPPDEEHAELPLNGEGYVKSADQMARLFADCPQAVHNAVALAERLAPPLDPEARHYPVYTHLPPGESAFSYLIQLVMCGAESRYPHRNEIVKARLIHELETIRDLDFCSYFLVCWDIGREARRRNVRFALRGSGVGSAVAHCLHLSEHDPIARNISFERFLSKGRAKPPDLDIDFQHDARDSMIDYVRETYGHNRVANVSNYVTFRARSLLRDVGKALGFDTGQEALELPILALLPGGMPDFEFEERYWKQWSAIGFSPVGHPMQFLRDALSAQGIATCTELQSAKAGQQVRISGLIVRPHKPPTAKGVVFFSLSDETALAHVSVMPDVYRTCGTVIYGGGPVVVTGKAELRGEGVSLLAIKISAL